jgi:LysM repeat protein
MTSNESPSVNIKEKTGKVCPYLGLSQDPQTTLAFPSASNLCYHAKPLASPNLQYQRSFCLAGRQHTLCPVFTRSEIAPLPPEISGSPAGKLIPGKPVNPRLLLWILLACMVLVLCIFGGVWLFNGQHGIIAALSGKPGSATPTSGGLPLATATFSITNIAITPNAELTLVPDTLTPSATTSATATPTTSQTPTLKGLTPLPVNTQAPCGSPNTWVVYIVKPGDSLYHISQIYRVTVADLQRANCLGSSSTLHTGQILYVPPWAPLASTPTPIVVIPTIIPTDTMVFIPPTDTATEPPVNTATEPPVPTEIPSDTPVSP